MDIRINGELIDVTLEDESNALEVISSIIDQFEGEEMIVSCIQIGGKDYSFEDPALAEMPLESIGTIDLEVKNKDELTIDLLGECKQMLHNVSEDIKTNGFAHVKEFNDIFDWVAETVLTINQLSFFNMAESRLLVSTLKQIREYINLEQKDLSKVESLSSIMDTLIQYLDAIQIKITSNFNVTSEEMKESINTGIAVLPEISEAFQLGKDKEALDKINSVISILELCCIYLKKNISLFSPEEKEEIDSLYEDINALLTQIVEAFENGDIVLLGDLLEYELPEKFENYKKVILGEVD